MSSQFVGEIRIMSFGYAPQGWALCNGQFLPINQNQALFSLLGTTYGGNGQTTFALPDLRGRVPIHFGSHPLGQAAGEQVHTLTLSELPTHTHQANGSQTSADPSGTNIPGTNYLSTSPSEIYAAAGNLVAMSAASVSSVGGSQAHQNMQPFLALTFCVALQGIFPSRN